jgi:hypothetical protein
MERSRLHRLRATVRHLIEHGGFAVGTQSQLASYFQVSRQYVHQIVSQERERTTMADLTANDAAVRDVGA